MIKKYFLELICVISFLASMQSVSAATARASKYKRVVETKKSARAKPNHLGSKLETEFQFNNLSVHGRYQGAYQGVATVENEKEAIRLIDYRRDYKDRLRTSRGDL